MDRQLTVTLALSRCTLEHAVVTWSRGRSGLSPWDEDEAVCAQEEARLSTRLTALVPAFEEALDELEGRGGRLRREPIAGVAELVVGSPVLGFARQQSAFRVRAWCVDGDRRLVARCLEDRFGTLLAAAPRPARATEEDFLAAFDRFTARQRTEPGHLQLARWLELAGLVSSQAPHRPCPVCGASAVDVEEQWVDTDWDASQRESLTSLCLEAPHVVTLLET